MIRGIDGVVRAQDIERGRFYVYPGYGGSSTLFQCIEILESQQKLALVMTANGEPALSLEEVPQHVPLVALPNVSVRVDPPSVSGSASSMFPQARTFIVLGADCLVYAPHQRLRTVLVNISRGIVEGSIEPHWLAFSRWSLVVDEGGEEVTIASFGEGET